MKKIRFNRGLLLSLFGVILLCSAQSLWGEVRKDRDLPRSGTLSSTIQSGQAANVATGPFGFDDNNATSISPISGSVSREGATGWRARVFNNSTTDTYSVRVEVIQRNERREVARRDGYTYTIPPKSSKSDLVPGGVGVKGAELNLIEFKNLTAKRSKGVPQQNNGQQAISTPAATVINPPTTQTPPTPPVIGRPRTTGGKAEWSYSSPPKKSAK